MAEYLIQDTTLTGIADAIRNKTGETGAIPVPEMARKIGGISGGSVPETCTVEFAVDCRAATSGNYELMLLANRYDANTGGMFLDSATLLAEVGSEDSTPIYDVVVGSMVVVGWTDSYISTTVAQSANARTSGLVTKLGHEGSYRIWHVFNVEGDGKITVSRNR